MNRPHRNGGPFAGHIREAIALNRERAVGYAAISGGASLPVSNRLIALERRILPAAILLDLYTERFRRRGIPLLSAEFVPMSDVPPFMGGAPPLTLPPTDSPAPPDPEELRLAVSRAYRRDGFTGAGGVLAAELERLENYPGSHCMLRHLLESALRAANLAPHHAARARELRAGRTEPVSWLLIRGHMQGLREAIRLDAMAAPLQSRGIPIICGDLPPIPTNPEYPPAPSLLSP